MRWSVYRFSIFREVKAISDCSEVRAFVRFKILIYGMVCVALVSSVVLALLTIGSWKAVGWLILSYFVSTLFLMDDEQDIDRLAAYAKELKTSR